MAIKIEDLPRFKNVMLPGFDKAAKSYQTRFRLIVFEGIAESMASFFIPLALYIYAINRIVEANTENFTALFNSSWY